ncbi:MAG: hypothetical protein AAGI69_20995 [Cyanobacteria bacterium P01_H01_bin.21]
MVASQVSCGSLGLSGISIVLTNLTDVIYLAHQFQQSIGGELAAHVGSNGTMEQQLQTS